MMTMAGNQDWGPAGGGFFRILGIVYLIKAIRRRRREHRRIDDTSASDIREADGKDWPQR
jgi:hypothetical protein